MLLVFLVFATALTAQRGGRMGGGGFHGGGSRGGGFAGHGYGGNSFTHRPGGFAGIGGYNRGFIRSPRYGFGAFRGGLYPFNSFGRARYGFGYYPYFSSYITPFWGYPSYYSPYSYDSGYENMAAGPNITVLTTPPAESTPSTIIVNSPPSREQARSEAEDPGLRRPEAEKDAAPRQPEPTAGRSQIYLIAARDGIVWAALAYWTDGATLHFVTIKGERKQMPLAQIDRDLSEQFNRERGVPFRLP